MRERLSGRGEGGRGRSRRIFGFCDIVGEEGRRKNGEEGGREEGTYHDQILSISQTPCGRDVQDAGRVRFRRAEAASDDRGDRGVREEGL